MELIYEPVKNQKFDIGRTINPLRCDCPNCDFMNCPKRNYAVKMKVKKHSVDEFFELYKEKVLKLNYYKKIEPIELKLSYFLITELVGDCIAFPKGTYWDIDNLIANKKDIDDSTYASVNIQKISRSGNIITLGSVRIADGDIIDYDFNEHQLKCAERISAAFKRVRELTEQEYEKRDTSNIGWMDRNGRLYKCYAGQHEALAKKLGASELSLENRGWVKIFWDYDKLCGYYCSAECYAEAHATVKVLDEDEAENCRCDIFDDAAIEKEKANIQKKISELQIKLDKLNNLQDRPTEKGGEAE